MFQVPPVLFSYPVHLKVSIFVGNLPFRAEQEDVIELFAQFGEVVNCALPLERDTGRKRGFAFIEMSKPRLIVADRNVWKFHLRGYIQLPNHFGHNLPKLP